MPPLKARTTGDAIRAERSLPSQPRSSVPRWLGVLSSHPVVTHVLCTMLRESTKLHQLSGNIHAIDLNDGEVPQGPAIIIMDAVSANLQLVRTEIREARTSMPGSKFIGLAGPRVEEVVQLLQLGFSAVVQVGEMFADDLESAVISVMSGSIWASESAISELICRVQAALEKPFIRDRFLTAREAQVLESLLWGLSNKEIAGKLGITERTVKFHISNMLSKVGVGSRRELMRVFTRSCECG